MAETEHEIYIDDLCTQAEFENMNFEERKEYIDKLYGNSNNHEIIAEITNIRDKAIFITAEYFFLFNEKHVIKFRICSDDIMSDIGSSGYFDKNITVGQVKNYCRSNNFKIGDKVICQLLIETNSKQIDRKKYLSFSIESLRHFDYKEIGEIYSKYEMNYEAGKFYRVESDKDLDAIVCQDIDEKLSKILDEKKSEIEQLEDSISQLKDLKVLAQTDYDKEIEFQKQRLNEECAKKASEIDNLIDAKREELKFIEAFGISLKLPEENIEKENPVNLKDFELFDEMSTYWHRHLNTAKYNYLKYDKRILESLYFGLQTDQLILLMGNPGTGKTSLVKALSKSFDFADAAIIPVQSNWTDKIDLLGYYNPLEKNYVSTPFLDALINFSRQALQNPEKLFIICLDEMNLAHIEYYFAEFLSILQDSDNAEITLYSEQLRKDILYELQNSGFKMDGDKTVYDGTPLENLSLLERKYYFELRRLAQMLMNYPAKFKIPKNVKFFGTLNQDETTLDISPKVLDRSYVVRIEKFLDTEDIPTGDETPLQYKPLEDFSKKSYENEESEQAKKGLMNLIKNLKLIHISRRITDKIIGNERFLNWECVLDFDKICDYIIASLILPKVRLSDESYDAYDGTISEYYFVGSLSWDIWQRIDSPEEKIADFWRR